METLAEKKWFGTVNSFRRCESSKRCGEWAVIFGIVIEVVVAGWSAKDEWKNKPENQPIRAITAQVFLEILGTNFDASILSQPVPKTMAVVGFFGKTNWLAELGCEQFASFAIHDPSVDDFPLNRNPNKRIYQMRFSWDSDSIGNPQQPSGWVSWNNISLKQLDVEMVGLDIGVPVMTGGMKIVRGTCDVIFNGSIQRKFSIPEYTSNRRLKCFPAKK